MADRTSDNRPETRNVHRGDRRPRWTQQPGEQSHGWGQQHEQFETGNRWDDQQGGGYEGSAYQGGAQGTYGTDQAWRTADRYYGGDPREAAAFDRGASQSQARYPSDYDAAGYRSQGRSYGSFTGNDFGGREFGGASSSWNRASGHGATGGYGHADDRGFLERAGDEVASWFGDDAAARRREADHRGRGPGNYTRSDQRILEDACDRITDDWRVDGTKIQVTVDNAEVTLDGTVSSREQKRRAEDCVEMISGVKHVQNNLRVDASTDGVATEKHAPFI